MLACPPIITLTCLLVCSLPVSICFFVSGCIFLSPFLCLCICLSVYLPVFLSVLQIRDTVMRIRDTVIQIRIPLFTLMRIRTRIWILIKVIKSAIIGERPGPSIAPFEHPASEFRLWFRIRIWHLAKIIRIGCGSGHCFVYVCVYVCLTACLSVLSCATCVHGDGCADNQ